MSLYAKELNSIIEDDLQALKENKVREDKTIEYKELLPSGKDSDKKKFLASFSSFANAQGGDLVCGIKESNGVPTEIVGCQVGDVDAETRRLDSILQDGLDPRVTGYQDSGIYSYRTPRL